MLINGNKHTQENTHIIMCCVCERGKESLCVNYIWTSAALPYMPFIFGLVVWSPMGLYNNPSINNINHLHLSAWHLSTRSSSHPKISTQGIIITVILALYLFL